MKKLIFLSLLTLALGACVIEDDYYQDPYANRPQPPRPYHRGDDLRMGAARALNIPPQFIRVSNVVRTPRGLSFSAITRNDAFQCFKAMRSSEVHCR